MVAVIEVASGAVSLGKLTPHLIGQGDRVAPRGVPTREIRNFTVVVRDPTHPLSLGIGRNMNPTFAALETLQLIAGVSDPRKMTAVAPNTRQFLNGGAFHGAYGPRIAAQMPKVIERLRQDRSTRRAVVSIWDTRDLFTDGVRDYPCTVGFNFAIRMGRLLMSTHMRSNDVWWGWTYDVVQFTQLQCTVANILELEPGEYTHYVDSMHIYERDIDLALALHEPDGETPQLVGLGRGYAHEWSTVAESAMALLYNRTAQPNWESQSWYYDLHLDLI